MAVSIRKLPDSISAQHFQDILGVHLRMANMEVYRDFSDAMAPQGITQRQAAVLWLVEENPGIAQFEIAETLMMDRPTLTSIVDKLEDRDWIERKRSVTDMRRHELYLTGEGKKACKSMMKTVRQHEEKFRNLYSADELEQLIEFLCRIHKK
jgi:DNA-binding MarR family transcriptional regulator